MEVRITWPPDGHQFAKNWVTECQGLMQLPQSFGNGRLTLFHRIYGQQNWVPVTANGMLTSTQNPIAITPQDESFVIPFSTTSFARQFEIYVLAKSDDTGEETSSNIVNIWVLGQIPI